MYRDVNMDIPMNKPKKSEKGKSTNLGIQKLKTPES